MNYLVSVLLVLWLWPSLSAAQTQDNKVVKVTKPVTLTIVLDIPLSPLRKTVRVERIRTRDIHLGTVLYPWEDNVSFGPLPTPQLSIYSKNFVFKVGGGIQNSYGDKITRRNKQTEFLAEGSIWKFLVGVEGFFEQEKSLLALSGFQFDSDFQRRSYGGRSLAGLKYGNYRGHFVSVKYGKGYVWTEGLHFLDPSNLNIGPLLLYQEEFDTDTLIFEGRFRTVRFSPDFKLEKNKYERLVYSTDVRRFGLNTFDETRIQVNLEVIPVVRHDNFRFMVRGSKYFGDRDGLMFRNDQPEIQVFFRVALN